MASLATASTAGETPPLTPAAILEGHNDRVWCVSWHPSGNLIASASGDKTVRLWERQVTGHNNARDKWGCVAVLEGAHTRTVRCVAWSPSGLLLAAGSFDATTALWQLGRKYANLLMPNRALEGKGDQEDDQTIIIEEENGDSPMRLLCILEGHEHEVKSVAWSSDGLFLATSSRDKTAWVWECDTESINLGDVECMAVLVGHTQDVKCVRWRPGTNDLMTSSYDNGIRFWPYLANEEDWPLDMQTALSPSSHDATVWSIDFEPNHSDAESTREASAKSSRFVSSDGSSKILVWSLAPNNSTSDTSGSGSLDADWKVSSNIESPHDRCIYSIAWAPYTKSSGAAMIASAGGDDRVCIYKEMEGTGSGNFVLARNTPKAHESDVNCVQFNPVDSTELATAGDDMCIKIWRL